MLLQCLLPDQAIEIWPRIKEYISRAVAPLADGDRTDLLLSAIADSRLQVICATDERGLVAVMTAFVNEDLITEKKTYILYTLSTLLPPTVHQWKLGIEQLRTIALQSGCKEMYAYTSKSFLSLEGISDTGYTIIKLL